MRENTSIPYSRIPNFGEAPSKQCLQAKLQCLVITKSIRHLDLFLSMVTNSSYLYKNQVYKMIPLSELISL